MSPVRRPSHRRHPDLETTVTSTEGVAPLEVDSGTAAVSAEDVASVEADSAVLKEALATAKRSPFRGDAQTVRARGNAYRRCNAAV